MKIKNVRAFGLILGCIFVLQMKGLFGLPGGTKISSSLQTSSIEAFSAGDFVTGYDLENNSFTDTCIRRITKNRSESIVEIHTGSGVLHTASQQLFYDKSQGKFVKACELTAQSIFVTRDFGEIQCLSVTTIDLSTTCYELSLDKPHLFFAFDQELLVHNFVQALPAVVATLSELLSLGAAITFISFFRTEKELPPEKLRSRKKIEALFKPRFSSNIDDVQSQISKEAELFRLNYKRAAMKAPCHDALDTIIECSSDVIGVVPDSMIYDEMIAHSSTFGPIYPLGRMTDSGDVECSLYVMSFDGYQQNNVPRFVWRLFGNDILKRSSLFVQAFVEAEDKKQLAALRSYTKSWESKVAILINQYGHESTMREISSRIQRGDFQKSIYGKIFNIVASCKMVDKNIPPSLVAQTITYGRCMQAKNPERIIYCDQKLNVAVLVYKQNKSIISIGSFQDLQELDVEPIREDAKDKGDDETEEKDSENTDIDSLVPNKISHVIEGSSGSDHKWERLVPNKNWNDIKKIIKTVLKEGVDGNYKGGPSKLKQVGQYTIEVAYRVVNGVKRISGAWVK